MNIRKKTLILLLSACCSVASQTVAMNTCNDVSAYNTNFNDNKKEKKEAEKKKKDTSKADEIIAHAMRYRGKAYRRGASGPNAFDCSGFTGFVFRKANIELKRSSREQFTQGVSVKRSDLQPGDLVFFSSPRSGKVVGHVGIVTEVCSNRCFKFIHAARSGIKVDDYSNTDYYCGRYLGARRVL